MNGLIQSEGTVNNKTFEGEVSQFLWIFTKVSLLLLFLFSKIVKVSPTL